MLVDGTGDRKGRERQAMKTFELLSIIGSIAAVGIALGAVVIGSNANLHAEMRTEMRNLRAEIRTEMRAEMHSLRTDVRADLTDMRADLTDMRSDIRSLGTRLSAVEQRQARTEGLLEGLRDAIAAQGRQVPDTEKETT